MIILRCVVGYQKKKIKKILTPSHVHEEEEDEKKGRAFKVN